jgi:Alpha/beta hydrolase domain
MCTLFRNLFIPSALLIVATAAAPPTHAAGQIDAGTLVSTSHGTFGGVQYTRHEAMFDGVTPRGNPYRVPCQIIAPLNSQDGRSLLLFDWLVPSTIVTAVGQEQADARYTLTDEFLFGLGVSYATVRCNPQGIGKQSPVSDPTRPWSDDLLDTSSEFITSAGDEYDIVVDYVKALRTDPVALQILGEIDRTAAFGYSASGFRLRGLLRIKMGVGLFDFSLVGGTGNGFDHPAGNKIGFSKSEKAPLPGAGLEIDFQSETDILALDAHKTRHEESNYRVYQFAGAAHIRDIDAAEFGLPEPEKANPADWVPFFRALFVAGDRWCDGIAPPPSLWLTQPVNTTAFRLPEVAVGENQYIPLDPAYDDGSFLGTFRVIAGGHVDLTDTFTNHAQYVSDVAGHAWALKNFGYLLEADAVAIIQEAALSNIGN